MRESDQGVLGNREPTQSKVGKLEVSKRLFPGTGEQIRFSLQRSESAAVERERKRESEAKSPKISHELRALGRLCGT